MEKYYGQSKSQAERYTEFQKLLSISEKAIISHQDSVDLLVWPEGAIHFPILNYKEVPKHLDATDGLAVAVCHHLQGGGPTSGEKKYSGWDSFIKNNPNRKLS